METLSSSSSSSSSLASANTVINALPGSYPNLSANPPPPASFASNGPSTSIHAGMPLRANEPMPSNLLHNIIVPPPSFLPPPPHHHPSLPMMPHVPPPTRGPSIVVPNSNGTVNHARATPPLMGAHPAPIGAHPPRPALPSHPALPLHPAPPATKTGSGVNKLIVDVKARFPQVSEDFDTDLGKINFST